MTVDILASIVLAFCNIRSKADFNVQNKIDCAEFMLNCSVGNNGEIKPKQVNECQKLYLAKPTR